MAASAADVIKRDHEDPVTPGGILLFFRMLAKRGPEDPVLHLGNGGANWLAVEARFFQPNARATDRRPFLSFRRAENLAHWFRRSDRSKASPRMWA